ncbi:MAG: ABC transporter permease [Ruminococcaceae bacterium]|nr:ABC transporter permease [Oscillospiraceae bacterium]
MVKPIIRVSLASLRYRKRSTLFSLVGIFLAVILIVVTAVFSVALLDLMLNMTFFDMGTPLDSIPTAADIAQIKDGDDSYTMMLVIVSLLMALAVLAAVSSISSVLTAGAGEKTKTLSVLSTLGASKEQTSILLITDALTLSVIAIPLGLAAGVLASVPMLSYLNRTTYAAFGMPHYVDTVTNRRAGYLALTALLALVAILLAACKPIWQARKRSSIEIAKGTDAINVSLRETPLDRFIERHFGIAGRLAAANFNNHRVKFKLIARSMSISALMFILFALFRVYLLQNNEQDTAFVFLFNFFYIFIGTLFAATFTGACALFYVHFNRRKSEFAMFRSMGMDTGEMARMVAVEGIYYGIYMFFYLLAGSLIVDGILFAALRLIDDYHFVYPWLEMGIALGIILVIMLALSLFMTVSVKRINIIAELKRNY